MRPTVLFILSTPYAGSHFLSLILGSNTRALHLGEMKRVCYPPTRVESRECYFQTDKIFEGLGPENAHEAYDRIFERVDPQVKLLVDTTKGIRWAARFLEHNHFDRKYIHLIRDPRAILRRSRMNASW